RPMHISVGIFSPQQSSPSVARALAQPWIARALAQPWTTAPRIRVAHLPRCLDLSARLPWRPAGRWAGRRLPGCFAAATPRFSLARSCPYDTLFELDPL